MRLHATAMWFKDCSSSTKDSRQIPPIAALLTTFSSQYSLNCLHLFELLFPFLVAICGLAACYSDVSFLLPPSLQKAAETTSLGFLLPFVDNQTSAELRAIRYLLRPESSLFFHYQTTTSFTIKHTFQLTSFTARYYKSNQPPQTAIMSDLG